MLKGFRDFILRGNIVDLAVAFVIGAAFAKLVTDFVADLISPLLAAFGGVPDLSRWTFDIGKGHFLIGSFVTSLLTFLVVGAVIYYFVVRPMTALLIRVKGPGAVGDKQCPYCMSTIALGATRCPNCTSQLEASAAAS